MLQSSCVMNMLGNPLADPFLCMSECVFTLCLFGDAGMSLCVNLTVCCLH